MHERLEPPYLAVPEPTATNDYCVRGAAAAASKPVSSAAAGPNNATASTRRPIVPRALVITDLVLTLVHALVIGAGFAIELSRAPLELAPWRLTAEVIVVCLAVSGNVLLLRGAARGMQLALASIAAVAVACGLFALLSAIHTGCPPLKLSTTATEISLRCAYNGAYLYFLLKSGWGRTGAPSVFLSYRRQDASAHAGWIRKELVKNLRHQRVFIDVEGLSGGDTFKTTLLGAVSASDALLVLITAAWADLRDPNGRRRLDDPEDWVVLEICAALSAKALVVPVLLDEARMPSETALPPSIRQLAGLQAERVVSDRLPEDVKALASALRKKLPEDPRARVGSVLLVCVGALLLGGLAAYVLPAKPTATAVLATRTGKVLAMGDGSCRGAPQLTVPEPGDEIHVIYAQVQNLQTTPLSIVKHEVVSMLDGDIIAGYKYRPDSPITIAPGATARLTIRHDFPLSGRSKSHVEVFDRDGCGATQAVRITTTEGVLPLVTVNSISSCAPELPSPASSAGEK